MDNLTTPVYPSIGVITNSPAPCASCNGAMEQDLVFDDLLQCTACGCRRSARQTPVAAACSHDALRALFEELLEECRAYVATGLHGRIDRWEREETDYRDRLDALMGEG